MSQDLFAKYDVPAPRYTSYPTVPYWSHPPKTEEWIALLNKTLDEKENDWSLYLHIPFCESLCTFCGCNTSITKNHDREMPYIETLLSEWKLYLESSPKLKTAPLKQFHFGGGSPTFLSPQNLKYLAESILKDVTLSKDFFEGGIEVDPRRTKKEHLQALREIGFNRVSLGVQDFNAETQRLIHRTQPFEQTEFMVNSARELGYESINFDLIYGLPKQTLETAREMIRLTLLLKPDRIALYSLAIVPWIKPAQKLFKDEDLPQGVEKRKLYELCRELLLEGGYVDVGMDHFALPTDGLAKSHREGTLHRNFMGYVDARTKILLGLGVSAISETPYCFHQNEKTLPVYERKIQSHQLPTHRGHILSEEDQESREQILQFMTTGVVKLLSAEQEQDLKSFLHELEKDKIIIFKDQKMILTETGLPFLRNACMGLDRRLRGHQPQTNVFSKSL